MRRSRSPRLQTFAGVDPAASPQMPQVAICIRLSEGAFAAGLEKQLRTQSTQQRLLLQPGFLAWDDSESGESIACRGHGADRSFLSRASAASGLAQRKVSFSGYFWFDRAGRTWPSWRSCSADQTVFVFKAVRLTKSPPRLRPPPRSYSSQLAAGLRSGRFAARPGS